VTSLLSKSVVKDDVEPVLNRLCENMVFLLGCWLVCVLARLSNKKLSYRRGTVRCVVSVEINCHATVQKLLVQQVLNKSKL